MAMTPLLVATLLFAQPDTVADEHKAIGADAKGDQLVHTQHPGAQWFPDAGLGLFIHWGLSSVRAINISWPMMDGRGEPGHQLTPNQYWEQAKEFDPKKYDPDKWLKAAKAAGFTYAVLTTRHHEGFALWPSAYGKFDTRNYMGGRDLVKPYVEACRRNGIKVGFYYSPPNWYFDKDYLNFSRKPGATVALDADHKPRTSKKSPEESARHRAEYIALVHGQIEELLTRYGKIDLLWFDGRVPEVGGDEVITQARMRELQPGIVINPRLHGHGDYRTFERKLTIDHRSAGWAEFCNTWTNSWPHVEGAPFRAPGFVLGQLVTSRALGVNYLLGVGPTRDGEFVDGIYANMKIVAAWMKQNGAAVRAGPLPEAESASVPATAQGKLRYLFAVRKFASGGALAKDLLPASDETLTLKLASKPRSVRLVGGDRLASNYADGTLTVTLPAGKRTDLVDVVEVGL
jgi:alpha-L-fucosidase